MGDREGRFGRRRALLNDMRGKSDEEIGAQMRPIIEIQANIHDRMETSRDRAKQLLKTETGLEALKQEFESSDTNPMDRMGLALGAAESREWFTAIVMFWKLLFNKEKYMDFEPGDIPGLEGISPENIQFPVSDSALERFDDIQNTPLMDAMAEGADEHGLGEQVYVLCAFADLDSGFNPGVTHEPDRVGLLQFNGARWESSPYAQEDRKDARANSKAGAWYLANNMRELGVPLNSPRLAYEGYGAHCCGLEEWKVCREAIKKIHAGTYKEEDYPLSLVPEEGYRDKEFPIVGKIDSYEKYARLMDGYCRRVQSTADKFKDRMDHTPSTESDASVSTD